MNTLSSTLNAADRAAVIEDNFELLDALIEALAPIGSVIAWCKTLTGVPALADRFVECNGQVLSDAESPLDGETIPNLNGSGGGTKRFLRGHTASGGTGGADTHTHDVQLNYDGVVVEAAGSGFTGDADPVTSDAGSSLPSYYEVVWVMRVK